MLKSSTTMLSSSVYAPRDWQKAAFKKIDNCLKADVPQTMAVNACVGSGKTDLGSYAFAKTIASGISESKKTISIFVSPRIKLCDQQQKSISDYIDPRFPELKDKYSIFLINCEADPMQFDRKTGHLNVNHAIFVFCDASLWGNGDKKDEKDNLVRWSTWLSHFTKWSSEENGFKLGSIFFDEAHNYDRNQDKIMKLSSMFQLTMLASGTPSAFQREVSKSKEWKKNTCECSPAEAMDKQMICKPSLNLITGDASVDFPNAILVALKREIDLCRDEVFAPRMLVNCSGIDQINSILKCDAIRGKIEHDFHVITIHSAKGYADDEGIKNILLPQIDGEDVESKDAYDVIESLDHGYFNDDLPVIVFQVGMIGEGINVKSFNSTIVTTHTDKTAMQQIGRVVRDCKNGSKTKIKDGHANVYAFFDNIEELKLLIVNLQNYDLTDECFDWGKKIDVSGSSSPEHNDENDALSKLNEFSWNDLGGTLEVITIMNAAEIKTKKLYTNEFIEDLFDDNASQLEWLLTEISRSDYIDKLGKHGTSKVIKDNFLEDLKKELAESQTKTSGSGIVSSKNSSNDSKTKNKEKNIAKSPAKITREVIIEHLMMMKHYAAANKDIFTPLFNNPKTRVGIMSIILRSAVWANFFNNTMTSKMASWLFK